MGLEFWFNLILTIFFFVPGIIHALWLVVENSSESGGG
ncbi:MAG TPA: hypothetical protein DCE33_05215 [Rhodospirillaceae bacterium]|nr:hypothetical protein [Rhodospirillaceae bacterium]